MEILVISDTHGDTYRAEKVIRNSKGIGMIIHLGDYFRDAQKLAGMFPEIRVEYVYGNSDFMIDGTSAEKLLEIEGKRIFITHGHRYSVKWDYEKLHRKAKEQRVDLLLFGHTHIADLVYNGDYYLVNPGSISEARGIESESYAIIKIADNKVEPRLLYV